MIAKAKIGIVASCFIATLILVVEPTLAQTPKPGEQVENVDWVSVIESILEFFANLLEVAADGVRRGVDLLTESTE